MSGNKPLTQQEKEPNAVGSSTTACCQPRTPWRMRAAKQHVEADEQQMAAPSDMSAGCDVCCGCKGSDEQPETV